MRIEKDESVEVEGEGCRLAHHGGMHALLSHVLCCQVSVLFLAPRIHIHQCIHYPSPIIPDRLGRCCPKRLYKKLHGPCPHAHPGVWFCLEACPVIVLYLGAELGAVRSRKAGG